MAGFNSKYQFGLDPDPSNFVAPPGRTLFKCLAFLQQHSEPVGTQEVIKENVVRAVGEQEGCCELFEVGMQQNILMDLNHETGGLNRRPHESFRQYWNRISRDNDFINAKKDYSLPDLFTLNV